MDAQTDTEEDIRRARDLLRDAIESLSEGFALYDDDRRLVMCNQRYKDMNAAVADILEPGLDWEILMRETARRGVYFEAIGREDEWIRDRLETTHDYVDEYELRHTDGSTYLVSTHPTKLGGFVVTRTDITERKKAEFIDREGDLLVRTVLDASSAIVIMGRTGDGQILYRSPAALELFGNTKSAREHYLNPEERADFVTEMLADGQVDNYRLSVVAKGRVFPASLSARFAEFRGEEVIVTSVVDLTEEMKSQALVKQVLEACPVPIQMTKAESGELLFTSLASSGDNNSSPGYRSFFKDTERRPIFIEALKRQGWLNNYRAQFVTANGREFPGAISARMIEFDGESVIVSSTRDMTEELALQDELSTQQEMLFQNEKMSALGELLAGVAHELNNPLSIVVGHSLMLREEAQDSETLRRIEKISNAAERSAKIVKTFLAMARQQPTKMEPVELKSIVATSVDVAGYGRAQEGLEIVSNIPDGLPEIQADADQITQVIINLVMNAHHAISRAAIGDRIEVSARLGKRKNSIKIVVKDNGPGVPSNIQARIFEPFFTTKEVGDGTGIGLAFCHRIVHSHGGKIWLDQNQKRGSKFCISLPIANDDGQSESAETDQGNSGNAKRVLVVDDEVDVGEFIAEVLTKEGFAVDFANSGREALELLDQRAFDVVLSDLNMPEVDGRGLYEALVAHHAHLVSRTAFITGDTMGAVSQKLLKATNRPFLEKPVAPEELRRLVYDLLNSEKESPMNTSDTHILVCDDEQDVREMVQEYLGKRGYDVSVAANADELRIVLVDQAIDLIILDINMPGEDGLAVLRSLRPDNMVPVVMLTAAGDVVDRIVGLEMGADDYLGKPVDLRELEARIKAVLRRKGTPESVADNSTATGDARFGDYMLNIEAARMTAEDGTELPLTAMEFSLLKAFAQNKGRVLNRDQILEQAHDRSWDPFDRSIDIRISRLRRKIEANPEKPRIIRTVRGLGYVYDPDG